LEKIIKVDVIYLVFSGKSASK